MAANGQPGRGLCLLALDGGGIRGVSELIILEQLMLTLRRNRNVAETPKPCDVFDMIAGTSTGGLIAILLGRMRLSVSEAIDEYAQLASAIFGKRKTWGHDGTYSATNFEKKVKEVVVRLGRPGGSADEDLTLVSGDEDGDACKVFVCTRSAAAIDRPRLFKSYGHLEAADYPGLKIWQAARATSAAPTFFKSLKLGPKGLQESFIDGGMGTNNPTKVLLEEADAAFGKTRPVACIISVGCGESNIIEVKEDPSFLERILPLYLINAMKEMVTDCKRTAVEMEDKFRALPGVYFRFNVEQGLQDVGLEEWKAMGAVKAKTLHYLADKKDQVALASRALMGDEAPSGCTVEDLSPKVYVPRHRGEDPGPDLQVRREKNLKDLHASLRYPEMDDREATIRRRAEGALDDTFGWVLDEHRARDAEPEHQPMRAAFRNWLRGDGTLFWVCGKAASGKSTLMNRIYHDPRLLDAIRPWAPTGCLVRARAFFAYEGTALQKSREGMLRSLLHQALDQANLMELVLEQHLHKIPRSEDYKVEDIHWSWEELCQAFDCLMKQADDTRRFCFFIDGLDEYSVLASDQSRPAEYYLDLNKEEGRKIRAGYRGLVELLRSVPHRDFVKICVSSRPLNEFELGFSNVPKFRLEQLTTGDITAFVQAEVEKYGRQEDYEECVAEIVTKAYGVFLWVRIATDTLVDGIINAESPRSLKTRLHALPSELGGPKGLYMRIVLSLDADRREEALRMFEIVLNARHDLTALVLSFAVDIHIPEVLSLQPEKMSPDEISRRSEIMQQRMRSCGGLLETAARQKTRYQRTLHGGAHINAGPVVQFIHLTMVEFLLRPDVQSQLRSQRQTRSFNGHVALLAACLLRLKHIGLTTDGDDLWGAIKDALYYASQAEKEISSPQTELLDDLDRTVTYLFNAHRSMENPEQAPEGDRNWRTPHLPEELLPTLHWATYEVQESGGKVDEWRDNFISMAVQADLILYVQPKIRQDDYSKQGRPLLAYAITPVSLSTMIQYSDAQADYLGSGFSSPEMVRMLLTHGADPNQSYKEGTLLKYTEEGPGIEQSVWQWALCTAMNHAETVLSRYSDRMVLWQWAAWKDAMLVLVEHGAQPQGVVVYEERTLARRRKWVKTTASVLYICSVLSWAHCGRNNALPLLLIDKGAALRPGELERLQSSGGCPDLTQDAVRRWLPGIREQNFTSTTNWLGRLLRR